MDPFNPFVVLPESTKPERGFLGLSWYVWAALFVAAVAIGLQGCATMIDEHKRVTGWPNLKVTEHRVNFALVVMRCYKYQSLLSKALGTIPGACAEINFDAGTCDIWLGQGEYDAGLIQHEREHCAGGDHIGDTTLADALAAYKARK